MAISQKSGISYVDNGVPTGGSTNQVLQKASGDDYDLKWGTVSGGAAVWGDITGTLSSQTDLQNALDGKQPLATILTNTTASFTIAQETKLAGIEAGADVTDATNVAAAGAVMESDYSPAHSILVQQSGTGSPTALQIGNNTLVGRLSGGGSDIDDLSASDVRTLLSINNVDNTSDANKPISTATQTALDAKQATLVSGTNIKTINGSSVLGSGDLVVSGSAAWGSITGTLSTQTDLQNALDDKVNRTAGELLNPTLLDTSAPNKGWNFDFTGSFAFAVGTHVSWLTNDRTWTWQDKNGTVAFTSDIIGNGKIEMQRLGATL